MNSKVTKNTLLRYVYLRVFSNCLSIRYLLQQKISDSLNLWASDRGFCVLGSYGDRGKPGDIALYRLKNTQNNYGITYRCAIALQLSSLLKQSPGAIATQLVDSFVLTGETRAENQFDFYVKVRESGWIEFQLSDRTLAFWLQQLVQTSLLPTCEPIKPKVENLFPIQYTHARCCSLLSLGHRQKLIDWDEQEMRLVTPLPVPWLNKNQLSRLQFQLQHPAEQDLIIQLLDFGETVYSPCQTNLTKIITRCSDALLRFDASCRIFGEVKTQTPQLAQARLGLVAATQKGLNWYLQELVGVSAPLEL
ncbi:MAG: DALR anticodon-binding domain-containing protein [Oscillatoria sp. PMC 1068.18]|nr:DALR anticodon-binding domain-containing protein [Oscillatoria sp. PMC 1076.18]MEC4988560.1 DALR anticodon-binding domain-containing protein [Oscillatoria sp. PMC 1068.18]